MEIIGIRRASRFSPNSILRDEEILHAVSERLKRLGYEVAIWSEDDFVREKPFASVIFSMARGKETLCMLIRNEQKGACVVNPTLGIIESDRSKMTLIMEKRNIPIPPSVIISFEKKDYDVLLQDIKYPCWIKRGDGCAQIAEDVSFVSDRAVLMQCCDSFSRRGIASAVISEHLSGDLVKFYGVADTNFFYFYYPTASGSHSFSKFGLEEHNGVAQHFDFDLGALKACADQTAKLVQLPIYGGDCIVAEDGSFRLIDFNDWPSFSRCTEQAAEAIVTYICKQLDGING